jgi:hypothetical protein
MRVIVLGAVMAVLSTGVAFAKCNKTPKWPSAAEGEVATTMNVSTGTLCPVTVRPRPRETFASATITKQPENGMARVRGPDRVAYRSNRGYAGPDVFSFTIKSTIDGKAAESTINVAVTVDRSFPRIRQRLGL